MAKRGFGAIPAEFLAEHVLQLDPRADWRISHWVFSVAGTSSRPRFTMPPGPAPVETIGADEDAEEDPVLEFEEVGTRSEASAPVAARTDNGEPTPDPASLAGLLSGLSIERAPDSGPAHPHSPRERRRSRSPVPGLGAGTAQARERITSGPAGGAT